MGVSEDRVQFIADFMHQRRTLTHGEEERSRAMCEIFARGALKGLASGEPLKGVDKYRSMEEVDWHPKYPRDLQLAILRFNLTLTPPVNFP